MRPAILALPLLLAAGCTATGPDPQLVALGSLLEACDRAVAGIDRPAPDAATARAVAGLELAMAADCEPSADATVDELVAARSRVLGYVARRDILLGSRP